MSIFDKFKVNPYISTYAGAPVDAFNQVATNLQARYDKNLADMDQIELQMRNVNAMDVDKAFKDQLTKVYQQKIEDLSQAPESATRGVRSLSREFLSDPKIALLKANQEKLAAAEKAIDEGDLTAAQSSKLLRAIKEYEEAGGAAEGIKFTGFASDEPTKIWYEEQDIGTAVDKRVHGILPIKSGNAKVDYDTGRIVTTAEEDISFERVAQSAMSVLADEKIKRQVVDEFRAENQGKSPTGEELVDYFFNKYIGGDLGGAVAKYAVKSSIDKLSGSGSGAGTRGQTALGNTTAATVVPGTSVIRDTYQLEAATRSDEVPAYQRAERVANLAAQIAAGEVENPTAAQNEINLLTNSLAEVLTNDGTAGGDIVIKDPAVRNAIAQIPASELMRVMRTTGDMSELQQALTDYASGEKADSDVANMRRLLQERYPEEIQQAFSEARKKAVSAANEEIRKLTGDGMATADFEGRGDIVDRYERQYVLELVNSGIDEALTPLNQTDMRETARLLENYAGVQPEEAMEFAKQINEGVSDTPFKRTYQDAIRRGAESVTFDRTMVGAQDVLETPTIESITNGLRSQFGASPESMNLEFFNILDEGKMRRLEEDDVANLDMQNLELMQVEMDNGVGAIRLKVPSKTEGEDAVYIDMELNKTQGNNILAKIGNNALRIAKNPANDMELRNQANRVAMNYLHSNYMEKGATAFAQNEQAKGLSGAQMLSIELPSIANVFGELEPAQDDGEYYFNETTSNGTKRRFRNAHFDSPSLALQWLFNEAHDSHVKPRS